MLGEKNEFEEKSERRKKIAKRYWQGGGRSDIITGLSRRRQRMRVRSNGLWRKLKKSFAKPLDKGDRKWYNIKVAGRTAANTEAKRKQGCKGRELTSGTFTKGGRKKVKKLLKNHLTKRGGCDIINRLSARQRKEIAHWKLNNNVLRKTPKILLNLKKL